MHKCAVDVEMMQLIIADMLFAKSADNKGTEGSSSSSSSSSSIIRVKGPGVLFEGGSDRQEAEKLKI